MLGEWMKVGEGGGGLNTVGSLVTPLLATEDSERLIKTLQCVSSDLETYDDLEMFIADSYIF